MKPVSAKLLDDRHIRVTYFEETTADTWYRPGRGQKERRAMAVVFDAETFEVVDTASVRTRKEYARILEYVRSAVQPNKSVVRPHNRTRL